MTTIRRVFVSMLVCALLTSASYPGLSGGISIPQETLPKQNELFDASSLFRAVVQVDNQTMLKRITDLGIVMLKPPVAPVQFPVSISVAASGDQLERLVRAGLRPVTADELGLLLERNSKAETWLGSALSAVMNRSKTARATLTSKSEDAKDAVTGVNAELGRLTAETRNAINALNSVDDDADGLTNTQETWWCTNPLNANSDGDGNGWTDGQEVEALLNVTLSRMVRWGYGAPFGPPNAWPDFNGADGNPATPACNDGDFDTIPDYAEIWMVGTRVPEESTDHDKFDDGQELFGVTYCPGAPTSCGYGTFPAGEYWNYIKASMPNWVRSPGDNPFVAAFPIPQVSVEEGTWNVQPVTTITTQQGGMTQASKTYGSELRRGQSTSVADQKTWNNWEEVSESLETPMTTFGVQSSIAKPFSLQGHTPLYQSYLKKGTTAASDVMGADLGSGKGIGQAVGSVAGGALCAATGVGIGLLPICSLVGGIAGNIIGGVISDAINGKKDEVQIQNTYSTTQFQSQELTNIQQVSVNFDAGGISRSMSGIQYAINQQGQTLAYGLHNVSTSIDKQTAVLDKGLSNIASAILAPRFTETRTNGRSWGGSQTVTNEEYEEHALTEQNSFATEENWSTAWAVDSSHAANLVFTYTIKNVGTEYVRELSGLLINIYLNDELITTYPAHTQFAGGKLENLFPADAPISIHTNNIPLTLNQMKQIDNGGKFRIVVADYSYGADELFYQNAINGGVTFYIEDGVEDNDENVDMYVIPTWQPESVERVMTRYFPANYDSNDLLNSLWTPEFNGINPPVFAEHFLSDIGWWNIYLTQSNTGNNDFNDMQAQQGSSILIRMNRDSDRDGYQDRVEMRYGTDRNDPSSHPVPEILAGYATTRTGNLVTATIALENNGTFDAYGIQMTMYSPDATTTVIDNIVGGNGRARTGSHIAIGSYIKPPEIGNWTGSIAKPYAMGDYSGPDRIFTFTVSSQGTVGSGGTAMNWSAGIGLSGTLSLGASYHAPLPLEVKDGLQLGFDTGMLASGNWFTVTAQTPRDTLRYVINTDPNNPASYTEPIIVVSFNDPQGNHKFVTPAKIATLSEDLMQFSGQMQGPLDFAIRTNHSVTTTQPNTTSFVFNSPSSKPIIGAKLFLDFVSNGERVLNISRTLDIQPGPNLLDVSWSTNQFSQTFEESKDNILIAHWTDSENNIIDTSARPLALFVPENNPRFAMSNADQTWNFGTAAQGTLLKRTFTFGNVGLLDLLTYVNGVPGLSLSQTGSRKVGPADVTSYEMALNTQGVAVGPYDQTITIRTSDPAQPTQTVHIVGTITFGAADTSAQSNVRPWDVNLNTSGVSVGTWMNYTMPADAEPAKLHPLLVMSADLQTRYGVGKYATEFSSGTAPADMFGDGRDGAITIGNGQTLFTDNNRAQISGSPQSGQTGISFLYPSGGVSNAYLNYWPKNEWFNTGLMVTVGDQIVITKDDHGHSDLGKICYGGSGSLCYMADGISTLAPTGWVAPGLREFSLVGRVGNGTPFYVGMSFSGVTSNSGPLYLGLNDCSGCSSDNVIDWWFTHQVAVYPSTYANFSAGDLALIVQMTGSTAGTYEIVKVANSGNGWINFSSPLKNNYYSSGSSIAQIIRIPQYSNLTIQNGGTLSAHSWSGSTGGIVAFRANGQLAIETGGAIQVNGLGFNGGRETVWSQPNSGPAYQGASYLGIAQQLTPLANAGGGGGGQNEGGGGGGYGTNGLPGNTDWVGANPGFGGSSYGASDLSTIFLGSGGGGSGHYYESAAQGGKGAGIIHIAAKNINVNGLISADGDGGWQGPYGGYFRAPTTPVGSTRNGGGGSGGTIKLIAETVNLGNSNVRALGGQGGISTDGGGNGGHGGLGRIRVEYCNVTSGSTNPPSTPYPLACYIAEQIEAAPYGTGRLNVPNNAANPVHIVHSKRVVFGSAGTQDMTMRVPAGLLTKTDFSIYPSSFSGNTNLKIDIGADGSVEYDNTVCNLCVQWNNAPGASMYAAQLNAFNQYWASHGAPSIGYLDVPIRVTSGGAGQYLIGETRFDAVGAQTRYMRISSRNYASVIAQFTVNGGSGASTIAVDVGANGSIDWSWNGTAPTAALNADLTSFVNSYLSGKTGDIDVPIRIYQNIPASGTVSLASFTATPSQLPDVTSSASSIDLSSASIVESDAVTVTATINNAGASETTGLIASFSAVAPGIGPIYLGSAYVPALAAGGWAQVSVPWNTLGFTGSVPVRLTLDPAGRVTETNEANNAFTKTVSILTRPDLRVQSIALSNEEPAMGEPVTVSVVTQNAGQINAPSSALGVYMGNPDDNILLSSQNEAVSAGNQNTITFSWTPTQTGAVRLSARADRNGQVSESDRGNNDLWIDRFVSVKGGYDIDSGVALSDTVYTAQNGVGVIDVGQPDALESCGPNPEDTYRRAPDGVISYRFDHLNPSRFYHLDIVMRACAVNSQRRQDIAVDGNVLTTSIDLNDNAPHYVSLLLDPALYADRSIVAKISAGGGVGAVISRITLREVLYHYVDAGANIGTDATYTASKGYGWLSNYDVSAGCGSLPGQTTRVNQAGDRLQYRFDGLNPNKHYRVMASLYHCAGSAVVERIDIDGNIIGSDMVVQSGQSYATTRPVPQTLYQTDNSIVIGVARTNSTINAMISEISLEEETVTFGPACSGVTSPTPYNTQAYGNAFINGVAAPVGTRITAEDPRGNVIGCAVVAIEGLYPYMFIYGEDATANPPIGGMRAGEPVHFRVDGVLAVSAPLLKWQNDNAQHRVDLNAGVTSVQSMLLQPNWNFISIRVEPTLPLVDNVFESITGKYCRVFGQTGTSNCALLPEYRSLKEIHSGSGYYIHITNTSSVFATIEGLAQSPDKPILLSPGWNWIGYYPTATLPVTVALAAIAGKYAQVSDMSTVYNPDQIAYNTLDQMQSGKGYRIFVTSTLPVTLTYPSAVMQMAFMEETGGGFASDLKTAESQAVCPFLSPTPNVTFIYGRLGKGAGLPVGTIVEALTPSGHVAGCISTTKAGLYGYMAIYGADGATPGFIYGQSIRLRVNGGALYDTGMFWTGASNAMQFDLNPPHTIFVPNTQKSFDSNW